MMAMFLSLVCWLDASGQRFNYALGWDGAVNWFTSHPINLVLAQAALAQRAFEHRTFSLAAR
jgi:hypothetical protein